MMKEGRKEGRNKEWKEERLTVSRHCHADRWPPSGDADYKVRVEHLLVILGEVLEMSGEGWDGMSGDGWGGAQ